MFSLEEIKNKAETITCNYCKGEGVIGKNICPECGGVGKWIYLPKFGDKTKFVKVIKKLSKKLRSLNGKRRVL